MRVFFVLIALVTLIHIGTSQQVSAQAPPVISCANPDDSGDIHLQWVPDANTTCGTTFQAYHIYVSLNADGSGADLVTSIMDPIVTEFIHTNPPISVPNDGTLYYYMTMQCGTLESGDSPIVSTDRPEPPEILNVTVVDENTVITWQPSPSPEVYGYVVYRENEDGQFLSIDTLYDAAQEITYIDQTAMADLGPEAYRMAAFNVCEFVTGPNNGITHQTIYLTINTDSCETGLLTLNWTPYLGWGGTGVSSYDIGVGSDSSNIQSISTVAGNVDMYQYMLPPEGATLSCFRVRAIRTNGDVSNSNTVCIGPQDSNTPDYIYLKNITIDTANQVQLTWNIDLAGDVNNLSVYRGVNDVSNLVEHIDITGATPFTETMQLTDEQSETARFSYLYQVRYADDCGIGIASTVGKTILLNIENQSSVNNLSWSTFELELADVQSYTIYRGDGMGNFTPVDNVSAIDLDYEDSFSLGGGEVGGTAQTLCYYVEATYEIECLPDGTTETMKSRSNTVCVTPASRIWVPNAFVPQGVANNVFRPVLLYPNADAYSMIVVNRWGEVMFQTSNPEEGWDGNYNGILAPQAAYAYVIKMTTQTGFNLERKGTVLLIR